MRIMGLRAENIKRLKMVDITPDGNIVKLTGKNGNGKTSVIDSICLALGGDTAAKLTKTVRAIRDGAQRGEITVDLGDYVVTRTWTANDKSSLKVENKDGSKQSSPQTLLNSFIGNLSYDPLEFMNMDPDRQVKTLHQVIGFDPKPLEDKRKFSFDERTLANRQIKEFEVRIKTLHSHEGEGLPEKELEASDMMAAFQVANNQVLANNVKRQELGTLREKSVGLKEEAALLEAKIVELQKQLEATKGLRAEIVIQGKALASEVDALEDPDLSVIQTQMVSLDETNRHIRERNEYANVKRMLDAQRVIADTLSKDIAKIDLDKENAIKNAKLPISGLGFGPDGVTYNDIPICQSSHAEKIRVSMAMGMAINPQLRVMFIKDGEKFDSDTWKMVEAMALDNDYQLWIEMVEESGKIGVYIEDGMVKEHAETTTD